MALVGGAAFLFALSVLFVDGPPLSSPGLVMLWGGLVTAVVGVFLVRRGVRAPSDVARDGGGPRAGDVYAMGGRSLLATNVIAPLLAVVGLIAGLIFLFAGLLAVVDGPGFGDRAVGLLMVGLSAGGFYLAVWMGRGTIQSYQLRRHQDPYFLVDDHGIECARGRVAWRDIHRVVEVKDSVGEDRTLTSLIVRLHEGAMPQPAERAYLDGMDKELIAAASLTPYGLELTIPNCATQARSVLSAYGHRPSMAVREGLPTSDAKATSSP